ncbi:MAG: hypothetical protein ACRC61_22360 [Aeromonas salmonicida]
MIDLSVRNTRAAGTPFDCSGVVAALGRIFSARAAAPNPRGEITPEIEQVMAAASELLGHKKDPERERSSDEAAMAAATGLTAATSTAAATTTDSTNSSSNRSGIELQGQGIDPELERSSDGAARIAVTGSTAATSMAQAVSKTKNTETPAVAEVAIELQGQGRDPELERSSDGAARIAVTGLTAATSMAHAVRETATDTTGTMVGVQPSKDKEQ